MRFSIPRTELFVAQHCFDPSDERHYIRCVYFFKEGYVSATNGRIAYLSRQLTDPSSESGQALSLDHDVAFIPAKNKKPSASTKRIEIDTDESVMRFYDKNELLTEIIPIQIVEGKRIDYKAFIARHRPAANASASINPELLNILSHLDSTCVNFTVGDEGCPSLIKAQEGVFLINPMAFTDIELPKLAQ